MYRIINEQGVIDISLEAGADLSAKQYYFVKLSSDTVVLCGANEEPLGILQNAPTSGQTAVVRVGGLSLLKVNEAVAFGDMLTSTSGGLGETADAADEPYGARVMTGATYAQNDLAEVLVTFGKAHSTYA